jgi:Entner-Doudoroff aldolase
VIGIGTITTEDELERAKSAGATFVVSPHTDVRLIERAKALGLIVIPGAMTPTEIMTARAAGADVVKLFPIATMGGPRFVEMIKGPLGDVPLWVSGGVGLDDIDAYVDAGVKLLGLTTALTGGLDGDLQLAAKARAAAAVRALVEAKEGHNVLTVRGPSSAVGMGRRELERLPQTEHTSLAGLVQGRRGEAVRIRTILSSAGIPTDARVKLRSQDGFERTVDAKSLYEGGYLQYANEGRRLDRTEGGPLRLFIVGGSEQCDNVKGLSVVCISDE